MFCLYSTNIVPCAAGGRGGEKSGRKKLGPFPAVFYPTFFVCSLRSRSMKYIGRVSHARERENTRGFTLACLPPSHSTHFFRAPATQNRLHLLPEKMRLFLMTYLCVIRTKKDRKGPASFCSKLVYEKVKG